MMTRKEIDEALLKRPTKRWSGEPGLGSVYGEEEIQAALDAIKDSMNYEKGFGFTSQPIVDFENAFANYVGTKHAIAVNSCGPGIDIVMRYLKLEPGDEVIVPPCNFIAAPLSAYGNGGKVVWGDVIKETLELDPADVERKITPRTRAIFPVHMNGLSAPVNELLAVAARHPECRCGAPVVICDAARACGGGYDGGKIGKAGLATIFSLHTMKNITTLGEGGMITTDSDDLATYARAVRMYGGGVEAWGTSNVMTKVQAAVGLVQLAKLDGFIADRRRLAKQRDELLAGIPEIKTPFEPADCVHSYYLYTCQVCDEWAGEKREKLIEMLDTEYGFRCGRANPPVYWGRKQLADVTDCTKTPVSDLLGNTIFCPPIHPAMPEDDNRYICAAIIDAVEKLRS